jgi:hypothetical protein
MKQRRGYKIFLGLTVLLLAALAVGSRPAPLVVDDFENGGTVSALGTKWIIYGDSAVGGKSSAQIGVIAGGANGSKKALEISGQVTSDFEHGFAGAAIALNKTGRGQDLTAYTGIRFYVRGDGNTYQVHVLTSAVKDHNEYGKEFVAGKTWRLVTVPFSDLSQSSYWGQQVPWTAAGVRGIAFQTLTAPLDHFSLVVDGISFY